MLRFSEKLNKALWFGGGFAIGFTLISLGHAAIPARATPQTHRALPAGSMVSEIKSSKVNSPEFDQDFSSLNHLEGNFAENWDQQQRIRSTVSNAGRVQYRPTMARTAPRSNKRVRR